MVSALLLRRFYCCSGSSSSSRRSNGASSAFDAARKKQQLVFMGSPEVSASVLDFLMNASKEPSSQFQLRQVHYIALLASAFKCGWSIPVKLPQIGQVEAKSGSNPPSASILQESIVTQPPSERKRGRKLMPSPVAQHALDRGFPEDLIFTPERAGEETFLTNLKALKPGLCVTAAYGNILPNKFLEIPQHGTVNIHPSLLPLYRGAAPVQRALQDGVKETGVSLAYTVRALDSGPIIASERVEVDDNVKAPELLSMLFDLGSKLLISELPSIFNGSAKLRAQIQDDSKATLAPKVKSEESWLSFHEEASVLHNKVRAFAGWPGTRVKVQVLKDNGQVDILELKVITTRVGSFNPACDDEDGISFIRDALVIPCAGHSALEVLEIQPPGKKVMNAREFWNGLQGRKMKKLP